MCLVGNINFSAVKLLNNTEYVLFCIQILVAQVWQFSNIIIGCGAHTGVLNRDFT